MEIIFQYLDKKKKVMCLLVVDFLQNCDSVLVNPVTYETSKACPTTTDKDSTEDSPLPVNPSPATDADLSTTDGMKSANDQSLVLDYNTYILNTVTE